MRCGETVDGGGGLELRRARILDAIANDSRPVVLLTAPSGYGKTVLARQIARSYSEASTYWVRCDDFDSTSGGFCEGVVDALGPSDGGRSRPVLLPSSTPQDDAQRASMELSLFEHAVPVCIVLDDLEIPESDGAVRTLMGILLDRIPVDSAVVITTRSPHVQALGLKPALLSVVDSMSLRLSEDEAQALVADSGAHSIDEGESCLLLQLSGGQVALFRVLLRQLLTGTLKEVLGGEASRDVENELTYLVATQLNAAQMSLLYAAALTQSGNAEELLECVPDANREDLRCVASCLPLLEISGGVNGNPSFQLHAIACEVFRGEQFAIHHVPSSEDVLERVLTHLERHGHLGTMLELPICASSATSIERVLLAHGRQMIDQGRLGIVESALDYLGSGRLVGHAGLLVLQAIVFRERGHPEDALRRASLARDIAPYDTDLVSEREALHIIARANIDLGELRSGRDALESILLLESNPDSSEETALVCSYLCIFSGLSGDWTAAREYLASALDMCDSKPLSSEIRVRVLSNAGAHAAWFDGRFDRAQRLLVSVESDRSVSLTLRIQVLNNLAHCLCEMGRSDRSLAVVDVAMELALKSGLGTHNATLGDTRAVALAAGGRNEEVRQALEDCLTLVSDSELPVEMMSVLLGRSIIERALGEHDNAMAAAERALEIAGTSFGHVPSRWLALLEVSASLLSLGDLHIAQTRASNVREEALEAGALYHLLRADLILAEIEVREGQIPDAVKRIHEHQEYILTESSNWQIGMYIRGFPNLLGVLGSAIDPDLLPTYLLKMILPEDAGSVLLTARTIMESEPWHRLALRIVGEERTSEMEEAPVADRCTVRLFGGLDVQVGERAVGERDWKKRKARMIFAILCMAQGMDVPRERLMEHLWPEMSEDRARNNFYVVWSAMKSALTPGAGRKQPCPYVENTGGVCRVSRTLVHSDVDEFDRILEEARDADASGKHDRALARYEMLAGVYRGDLLPGDMYEDWFAEVRERYRHAFSDSMMRAAELLLEKDDPLRAMTLVRAALSHDPWREDLYQIVLRCQIASEQRSAAVETYMTCRNKLAEDLGLDPSSETMRLYEQVLAMEEGLQ